VPFYNQSGMKDMQSHFMSLAVKGVHRLQPYVPGKPIAELEREYGVSNIIKLASNENPLGCSPAAIAACNMTADELALYPDGNGFQLKQALANKHGVDINSITLGNGSNDILEFVARVFLSPGYNAVFSEHAFAVYPLVSMAVGAELNIAAANNADHDMPYGHDLEGLLACVNAKTRVVFIANPNNPTGTWLGSDELEAFIAAVSDDVIIVLDEAYIEYVTKADYPDSVPWLQKYPNLVITRTFSKAYGLAGLRVGYSISHPAIADLLNRVRQPFNTNSMAQAAALAALSDSAHIENSVTSNTAGLKQLFAAFKKMGIDYIPSVANFISFKTELSGDLVYDSLLRKAIIIRPISNYGLPDYLRVTVGSFDQNEAFLNALAEVTGISR